MLSIPKIAALCSFWHTKTGVKIDLPWTVNCKLYTPSTFKSLPPASTSLVTLGNFSGLWSGGISRNCLTDIQVTDAPESKSQSDVPLLEVTLTKGRELAVFHRALHDNVKIAKIFSKKFLVGEVAWMAATWTDEASATLHVKGVMSSDVSLPFT